MEHMELKVEMIKARILHDKGVAVHNVEHLPEERKLVFITPSFEISISGDLYDKFKDTDSMYDVLNLYDAVSYQ